VKETVMAGFSKRLTAVMAVMTAFQLLIAMPARAEDWVQAKDTPEATVTLAPLPQGWTLGGSNVAEYSAGACSAERFAGQASGALVSTGFNFAGGAYLAKAMDAAGFRGQRVRLTARIKTVNVRSGASLWLSPTGTAPVEPAAMVQGTSDWQTVTVVADIPADARQVSFGTWLSGRGQVFVSGIRIDVVRPDAVAQGNSDMAFGG
jgi:hypothetical protein